MRKFEEFKTPFFGMNAGMESILFDKINNSTTSINIQNVKKGVFFIITTHYDMIKFRC